MKVKVVPHDPVWPDAFEMEAKRVADALGDNVVAVHHVGSTAIPGIYAKPVIDQLVEVIDITRVDDQSAAMEALGYEAMGELGISGRRYFRKSNAAGERTHHAHVFERGNEEIQRHLLFRDYMVAHPDDAREYSDLKRKLGALYPQDIESYMDGKDAFIKAMDLKAAQWHAAVCP